MFTGAGCAVDGHAHEGSRTSRGSEMDQAHGIPPRLRSPSGFLYEEPGGLPVVICHWFEMSVGVMKCPHPRAVVRFDKVLPGAQCVWGQCSCGQYVLVLSRGANPREARGVATEKK